MAGIFDLKKGAFDSSEAARLYEAYAIALQGMKATHKVDQLLGQRLARAIVKVARGEPDCLNNDGTIDPVRLAQRAVLRMLQLSAPAEAAAAVASDHPRPVEPAVIAASERTPESPSQVMRRIFDGTRFAKL